MLKVLSIQVAIDHVADVMYKQGEAYCFSFGRINNCENGVKFQTQTTAQLVEERGSRRGTRTIRMVYIAHFLYKQILMCENVSAGRLFL